MIWRALNTALLALALLLAGVVVWNWGAPDATQPGKPPAASGKAAAGAEQDQASTPDARERPRLTADLFSAAPPPPATPAEAEKPPPEVEVEVLGVAVSDGRKLALVKVKAQKGQSVMRQVFVGSSLGGLTVEKITEEGIACRDRDGNLHEFALSEEK